MQDVDQLVRKKRFEGVSLTTLGFLILLLIAPAIALSRLASFIDWRVLIGVPFAVSVFSFFSYRSDKRRAEGGEWRIPEARLHLVDLMGGWPGAYLAQRIFRHKISKYSFQFVFWFVVLIHEFLAVDSLLGWRFTQHVIRFIKAQAA
jgi:uncharacterized membrane protein YsdA (DUF1294 family)